MKNIGLPSCLALAFAAGVAVVQLAQHWLQPAIADTAPAPAEVVAVATPEPVAIDDSANKSTASDHGPLIDKNGLELAPYAPHTCADFYNCRSMRLTGIATGRSTWRTKSSSASNSSLVITIATATPLNSTEISAPAWCTNVSALSLSPITRSLSPAHQLPHP